MYVTNRESNTVSVIDEERGKINTIPVGKYPLGIAIDNDTKKVYVTNRDSNTTSIIDGTTDKVVKNVTVGSFPDGIAIDPNTRKVYVANVGDDLDLI